MTSVTARIKTIKQPRGGYILLSKFKTIALNDGIVLNEKENVHASIIGMVVDYLSRCRSENDIFYAFDTAFKGASIAEDFGFKEAFSVAGDLLENITGIDDNSIINACKLVTFDVWLRNPLSAVLAKSYQDINPDKATIQNIQTLIKRSTTFFETFGYPTDTGFTFGPIRENPAAFEKMIETGRGTYGGYTATVSSGDGDFLTEDILWDFKVSKSKPTSQHTLQLLMYWIMGQHSGQDKFKNITRLGIFNPRLNTVYLLNMEDVSPEIIATVEKDVICYE